MAAKPTGHPRCDRSPWVAYALVALVAAGCALLAAPMGPPRGSESAQWLAGGPYHVETVDFVVEDDARGRALSARLWRPAGVAGPVPLVVQVHGFLSEKSGGAYVARDLASRGYVVVAATHPGATLCTPGGARVEDVVEQPADVSFLIDRLLVDDGRAPRHPPIDPARIAVMGHSLGGLTVTLAAFHPRLRDPRIVAAISLAGPMEIFEPRFFRIAPVPFLMIAASGDTIVEYRRNALVTLDRVPNATVVVIAGASHAGFDDAMTGLPRLLDNPDELGCWMLGRTLRLDDAMPKFRSIVQEGDGISLSDGVPPPCLEEPPPVAMDPARQQMITRLAVAAFLESLFAPDPATRAAALGYLTRGLARDFGEVSIATPAAAAPAA